MTPMRDRPENLAEEKLRAALCAGWCIRVESLTHLPIGFGSHHWSATDQRGSKWFVKVDDLGFVADGQDEEFGRLSRSQETALTLHRDAGLGFVLAPVPAGNGAPLWRLSSRYALSVFPTIAGVAGQFGPHRREEIAEVTGLIAEVHRATPAVAHLAPRADLLLPGRDGLNAALADLGRPWTGGPHAAAARDLLLLHEERVRQWLERFDQLVAEVRGAGSDWVVTHGEPHPGNILRSPTGAWLIDWATVQLAPPERDVWMLTDAFAGLLREEPAGVDAQVRSRYRRISGRTVSPSGIALYRLWWPLADVAAFLDDLRRPHGDGADAAAALRYLAGNLEAASA